LQSKAAREASQTQPSKGLSSKQAHLPHTTAQAPQEQQLKMSVWTEGDACSLHYPSISHPIPSQASAVLGAVQTQMIYGPTVLSDSQILKLPSES